MTARLAGCALLAAGCSSTGGVEGTVDVVGMSPRAGISVRAASGACTSLTAEDGQFVLTCPTGSHTLVVEDATLPHFALATTVDVAADQTTSIGNLPLIPRPSEDGLWQIGDQALLPLPEIHLIRTGGQGEKAYCLPPESAMDTASPSNPDVILIDQQSPPWRLFRLDEQGCAQRAEWHAGDWRPTSDTILQSTSVQRVPGASLHHFALEPGAYFVADWSGGRWTPDRAHAAATGEKRYMGAVIVVAE